MKKEILTTKRLILREILPEDAVVMFELNSNKEVLKYTGDKPFDSVEEVKEFLTNYSDYTKNGFGRWLVQLRKNGEIIGWCGLKKHPDNKVDLGYRFFQHHWNKGYATESAKACLNYGFIELNLKEIIGNSDTRNNASIRVLEKIGLSFWKKHSWDGIEDAVTYKITINEYKKLLK